MATDESPVDISEARKRRAEILQQYSAPLDGLVDNFEAAWRRRLQLTTFTRQHCAKPLQGRCRDSVPSPSRSHRQTGRKETTACRIRKSSHPSRLHRE